MKLQLSDRDLERFWSKTEWSGDCIVWTSQTRAEYGLFRYKGKIWGAHRFAYALEYDLDEALQVCHTCDNPSCVRSAHLFQGTAKVNSDDKMIKDRYGFTFSNEQVVAIRNSPVSNTMVRDLAEQYAVKPSLIKSVLSGESYGHLPGAIEVPPQFTGWILTAQQVKEIMLALEKPYWGIQAELAKKYGVKKAVISHINTGHVKYTDTL
jgi:hypothetical protein